MTAQFKREDQQLSRRTLLKGMGLASVLFHPAPMRGAGFLFEDSAPQTERTSAFLFSDHRLVPHYPGRSPLTDVLALVPPGSDEFITELYAFEIESILKAWSGALKSSTESFSLFVQFLDPQVDGCILTRSNDKTLRSGFGIDVVQRQFKAKTSRGTKHSCRKSALGLSPYPKWRPLNSRSSESRRSQPILFELASMYATTSYARGATAATKSASAPGGQSGGATQRKSGRPIAGRLARRRPAWCEAMGLSTSPPTLWAVLPLFESVPPWRRLLAYCA